MAFPGNTGIGSNLQIIDPVLSNLLIGYKPYGFILDQIFAEVPVDTTFGRIPKFGGQHLRIESQVSFQTPANIPYMTMSVSSTQTYEVKNHILRMWYDYVMAQQFGGVSNIKNIFNYQLADNLMLSAEASVASVLTSGSYMSGLTQAASANYVGGAGDPLSDFAVARQKVYDNSGMEPNVAIMDFNTFNVLRSHTKLIDVAFGFAFDKARSGVLLTEEQLAVAMSVQKVLVGRAKYNSAELGQTAVYTSVWGKGNIIFAFVNPALKPNMAQQSLGYKFLPGAATVGYANYSYSEPEPLQQTWMGEWVIQGRMYDYNICDNSCAYLLTGCAS
jgi:hypothetical protein